MGSCRQFAGFVALIVCGASVGTTLRNVIELSVPHEAGQWPWATFAINIVGSFVLGVLLEALAVTGPDEGWRRVVRLSVGTGVIGGFTTYSTFVVEADQLGESRYLLVALAYAVVSVVVGIGAAALGMGAVGQVARRRESAVEEVG